MLAHNLAEVPDTKALLSLASGAELLRSRTPPETDLFFKTYRSVTGFARRVLSAPVLLPRLERWLQDQRIDVALCAMPAALDLMMAAALRRAGVPFAVVVHDASRHPGDVFPVQMILQRRLIRQADGVFALTAHVADGIRAQGLNGGLQGDKPLFMAVHPPFSFGPPPPPPMAHKGPMRLLSFGRLLPYKGLDLLLDGMTRLGPRPDFVLRVVGHGPDTPELAALAQRPGVTVENRWVPEDEVGALIAWSDALILSHREASQSGVAAAAIAARRWVVATRVGGLAEQLQNEPMARMCEPTGDGVAAAIADLLSRHTVPSATQPAADLMTHGMATALRSLF